MKTYILIIFTMIVSVRGFTQYQVRGKVVSTQDNKPLMGANIKIKGSKSATLTNKSGEFSMNTGFAKIILQISFVGYQTREVEAVNSSVLIILLSKETQELQEVMVSTGYQHIPEERATGSFTQINNQLFNRAVGTDVISRLEGITNSLHFDRRAVSNSSGSSGLNLRIRGESSIKSNTAPLIVLDNFPYEGDINAINPNDVESITVLKDAAAASIWGAQAGNGVIVITSKKGKSGQLPTLNFTTNYTLSNLPDLAYNPNYLTAPDFIDAEKELFSAGVYTAAEANLNKPIISPVVEILIRQRDKQLSQTQVDLALANLKDQDVRKDLLRYFYQKAFKQQYAVNINGGTEQMNYYISGGYDKNRASTKRDQNERISFSASNTYRPLKFVELNTNINYVQVNGENNSSISTTLSRFPYNQLADSDGSPLAIPNAYRQPYINSAEGSGLLDWQYRPLRELALANNKTRSSETRINTDLKLRPLNGLTVDLKYQYQKTIGKSRKLDDKSSYYVRNLVNKYTQTDGTRIFPYGDILTIGNDERLAQAFRGQLNFEKSISDNHDLNILAGTEVRQVHFDSDGYQLYGYDDHILASQNLFDYNTRYPVRPRSTARLPLPATPLKDFMDRYLSYYGNAAYTYQKKYILSGSIRWDASNLFGVKTNQKGVPLWSAGASWILSNEDFYSFAESVPYLKLRATYGYNGNVNKSVTAFVTAKYFTDALTDLKYAEVRSPGNPSLRWEKVGMLNLGLDFKTAGNRLSGSLEYYHKKGVDLLGENQVDLTTGYRTTILTTNLSNYANTKTNGVDVELNTLNINSPLKWESNLLLSYVRNKVTAYNFTSSVASGLLSNSAIPSLARVGKSLDAIYNLPWYGLDPLNGDPLVNVNGVLGKNYTAYIAGITEADLITKGLSVPPFFGSLRNTFTWKNISLSAIISWKLGYYFRRSSINYSDFINSWIAHKDFSQRWKSPGDELITQVPSMPLIGDTGRDLIYNYSGLLVEKGDHVRLQDIQFSYLINKSKNHKLPVNNLKINLYFQNPGIIWRANKQNLDPDYPSASYPPLRNLSVGFNASF